MNVPTAIELGVLIVTLAPLYAMLMTFKQTAANSYVEQLEARVDDLQEQLTSALNRVESLEKENVRLMRLVMNQKGD